MISRASLLRWFTNQMALDPNETDSAKGRSPVNGLPELQTAHTDGAVMIAHSIMVEANAMEQRMRQDPDELAAIVVAGVSRIEELINELVANTRAHASAGNGLLSADLTGSYGLSELLSAPDVANR
jgi:hypothetical protein